MAYETIADFDCVKTIAIGGIRTDKKTGKRYKNLTQLEGYYVGSKTDIENKLNPDKPTQLHIFKTEEGNVGVWGKTDMDRKMKQAKVGLMTLVQFDKMIPTNKQPMFGYIVKQDKLNVNESLQSAVPAQGTSAGYADDSEGDAEAFEEETALDAEEDALDEPAAAPAKAPKAAVAPSPDRQAAVQGLLGKKTA